MGWLSALPRLLWELGPGAAPNTWAVALGTLHDVARFSTPGSELGLAVRRLQPQLAPLWSVQVPGGAKGGARGKAGKGADGASRQEAPQQRVVAGPVMQLPERLQALAIDILCQLGERRALSPFLEISLLSAPLQHVPPHVS